MPRPRGKPIGLSFDEISKRLNMPRTSVQAIARRAILKMRQASEEEGYSFESLFGEPGVMAGRPTRVAGGEK